VIVPFYQILEEVHTGIHRDIQQVQLAAFSGEAENHPFGSWKVVTHVREDDVLQRELPEGSNGS